MKLHTLLWTAGAVVVMTALNAAAVSGLPDGEWYTDAVKTAVESGFITYENDTFAAEQPATVTDANTAIKVIGTLRDVPYMPVLSDNTEEAATRGYFCSMLGSLFFDGSETNGTTRYLPDVSIFARNGDYIYALYDAGILCGTDENGSFNGDAVLTKEELSVLIVRALYPETRVQKSYNGVSARDAFDRFDHEKTVDDNTAYSVSDTGFVLNRSMYDFAASAEDEEAADDTLFSLAAIEKILYLYDYCVSEDMFGELRTMFAEDWAEAAPFIAEQGMDVSEYAYYQNYVLSNYYDVICRDFMLHDVPTMDELFELYGGGYALAKHILIQSDGTEEGDAAALAAITEVKNQLDAGADFDELMAKYGEDPGMKQTPGGYCFTRGEMVQPFEDAVFALGENEMSGIVKTDYGYHIIYRLPLTAEIFASNTDLCENLAYYTAYTDWQNICDIVISSLSVEKQ